MKSVFTVDELLEVIRQDKRKAIEEGIIREEKTLEPIKESEKPYILPEGWSWDRLGNYCLKVTDYVASGSFASLKANVLITNEPNYAIMVKTADFSNGFTKNLTYTDKRGYEFLSNSNLFGGELILSNIGSIGKVFIVPYLGRPMTLASNTIMVKMTDDRYIKYLYYYFLSPAGQRVLTSISSGTSVVKFNKTQLKNILIPIAPLSIQEKIVQQLEMVTRIIKFRKQQLQKLDDLVKARFVEMFGDLRTNNRGWKIVGFKDCAFIDTNMIHNFKGYEDYPHIGIDSIERNTGRLFGYRTISEDGIISGKYLFTPAHIIYSKIRPNLNKVALPDFDGLCSADAYPILVKSGICNREYLGYTLRSDFFLDYILAYSSRTNLPKVNKHQVEGFTLPLPPIELQQQFSKFVKQVNQTKAAIQTALTKTQQLYDSLMQQYFG